MGSVHSNPLGTDSGTVSNVIMSLGETHCHPIDCCARMLLWAMGNSGGTAKGLFLPSAWMFSRGYMKGSIGFPRVEMGKPLHLYAKGVVVPV